MDVCGKSLREKNGDAHKGIQNVTIRIVNMRENYQISKMLQRIYPIYIYM
jgi:hypothetical protein